jgi:small-conductance mechanosensitive channel
MDTGSWSQSLEGLAAEFSQGLLVILPRAALAAGLLVAGWVLGRVMRWMTTRIFKRVGRIRGGRAVDQAVQASGVERMASQVVSRIVFWIVFLFFAALAGDVLGLAAASNWLGVLIGYLPSVLAAFLIVVAGLVLSNLARDALAAGFESAGMSGRIPGRIGRYTILLLAAVVALDQMGIDSTLLILAVGIVLAAILGSAALAVGLGARTEAANVIALYYLSRSYSVGQTVRIGETEGRIAELRANGVVLETADGQVLVPAKEFSERASRLVGEVV